MTKKDIYQVFKVNMIPKKITKINPSESDKVQVTSLQRIGNQVSVSNSRNCQDFQTYEMVFQSDLCENEISRSETSRNEFYS